MKTIFNRTSELANYIGQDLGVSPWFQIEQSRIDDFARVTEDYQWIHLDVERAQTESPYGNTIAHGFLILSLMPHLVGQSFEISERSMGINYGMDRVRFTNAVKAGASIRARVSLAEYLEIKGGGKYKLNVVVEIKDEAKPACVAELIALVYD